MSHVSVPNTPEQDHEDRFYVLIACFMLFVAAIVWVGVQLFGFSLFTVAVFTVGGAAVAGGYMLPHIDSVFAIGRKLYDSPNADSELIET